MTSVVQIANMALGNIGDRSRIDSLTEASPQAQAAQLYYETARDATLEAHDWGFARKVAALALTGNTPLDTSWGYEYIYPADCLKMRRLLPEVLSVQVPWERGVSADGYKIIWTNLGEAYGRYTLKITDSSFFSAEFVEALSWKLGSMMAMKVTGSSSIKREAEQQFRVLISGAHAGDFAEQNPERETDNEFIRARS